MIKSGISNATQQISLSQLNYNISREEKAFLVLAPTGGI